MSKTTQKLTSRATVPQRWKKIPCVQYGFPEDEGPRREPKLRTIYESVPEGATVTSPIYVLTREQYERQQELDTGYEVSGDVLSIATELQNEAENNNRVLYPVHIESDELWEKGPESLIDWFQEFVEDYLELSFDMCKLYFSGNRSIHVHVPRFVSGENQREQLKELAETFCTQKGAELDCGLYSAKRMFRLPGVEHQKTGTPKLAIDGEWDKARLSHKVNESSPDPPESYAEVLQHVFVSQETLSAGQPPLDNPFEIFSSIDSNKTVLELGTNECDIETPLIEQKQYPENAAEAVDWLQYNAKEFSPYAFAEENPRSVAALRTKARAFGRENRRSGATMVPAYFYGAIGCNGEFTKEREHAPLQLSPHDYNKWDFQPGDTAVIIGGQSRRSRILDVDSWHARVVGHALTGKGGNRDAAYHYLESEGYDTGSAGSTTATSRRCQSSTEVTTIWPARENPRTEAEALQQQAEQEGITTLKHDERIKVACRHLRYGWDPAWEWFKEQFGSEFKPRITWKYFKSVVEEDEFHEYDNIEPPEEPP